MRAVPKRMAVLLAALTLAELAVAKPGLAAPPGRAKVQQQRAVPGHVAKALPRPKYPKAADSAKPGKVSWPAAGRATAAVAASGPTRAGSLPVRVSRPAGIAPAAAGAVPAQVGVQVLDRAATARAGVAGVLMRLSRTDGQSAAGTVNVQVDYRGFRNAVGADWASRLHLVELPECALTNPACGGRTVLRTDNNVAGGTASADVPVGGG